MTTTTTSSLSSSSCQVRVGVRIRPLTANETSQGGKRAVDVVPPNVGIGKRRFTYDSVFDSHVSQSDLYQEVSPSLLNSFLEGYNATVMAYGQTGSGKTYTMGSEASHSDKDDGTVANSGGLLPRFMADIFDKLAEKKMKSDMLCSNKHKIENSNEEKKDDDDGKSTAVSSNTLLEYRVSASFLEVYGEDVHDLLDEDRKTLPLREDSNGGVIVVGLKSRPVSGAKEALKVLHVGTLNRTTASTLMNLHSSRSHAVFTISLEQTFRSSTGGEGGDVDVTTTSQFTFVDLAGSERMKKTGAEGTRALEGIKINQGLLALGNVINALADEERLAKEKNVHVPYRQSKLTRLLQDALGGNSQTLFLACVSPSDTNASETLSTLHYANRARNIKNAPTKNVDATILEMQRLHALTHVLQCELVKQRFQGKIAGNAEEGKDEDEKVGHASEVLLKRKDVQEYIQLIHQTAAEQCFDMTTASANIVTKNSSALATRSAKIPRICFSNDITKVAPASNHVESGAPNLLDTTLTKFDDALLDEVNPDEEMAMLDQLLELQHKDNEFDKEQKKDQEELEQVEGELQEQESMLLHLRESLKVYHNMKGKYEVLMTEVQNFETEKATLADQLEKSTKDPSTGCSMSIKKKLETVERSLSRARTETRRHQQMYRKAELEAQKCKILERKISDLKHGKVTLVKKQREAAARHREYTEMKTREITALKRKERKTGQKVSKLEKEIRLHKTNLEKRKVYCDKLSDKLKQTEAHLMKLLVNRKKELRGRTKGTSGRPSNMLPPPPRKHKGNSMIQQEEAFAPKTEEISSLEFMLEQIVAERIEHRNVSVQYEEKVAKYGELMRNLVEDMKALTTARNEKKTNSSNDPNVEETIHEHEQNVEDLEIKIELVSGDLDNLRTKMSHLEDEKQGSQSVDMDEPSKSEEAAMNILANQTAPVIRTLLWETLDKFATSEFDRKQKADAIDRKEAALRSFETEVESLNKSITALSEQLTERRKISISTEDPVEQIQRLENRSLMLIEDLQKLIEDGDQSKSALAEMQNKFAKLEQENAVMKEKLTVSEAAVKQTGNNQKAEMTLGQLQDIWQSLGVAISDREIARMQIESCLEDTCIRKLKEAKSLKTTTLIDIASLQTTVAAMYSALGIAQTSNCEDHGYSLMDKLEQLKNEEKAIRPTFISAVERRAKIAKDIKVLMDDMTLSSDYLPTNVATMIRQNEEQVRVLDAITSGTSFTSTSASDTTRTTTKSKENGDYVGPPNSLKESFLELCEQYLTALRVRKSEILVKNTCLRDGSKMLVDKMHLSQDDILSIALQSAKRRLKTIPSWWNIVTANKVAHILGGADGVVAASFSFSQHLELIHQSLSSISNGRRSLSTELQGVIKRAQETLLMTVGGEVEVSEAYKSFHDALFQIPSLSKEHIYACITEMKALTSGVDAMTQSEIEALTVVWEALNITASERGRFWNQIDDFTTSAQTKVESPFDSVLIACTAGGEEWVLVAVKDATKIYRELNVRLLKLENIHSQVERLRSKQDIKSKILSYDSEIRILKVKLEEFEGKKCCKQRLVSKTNSSALLKEERFRKQMKGKFVSKLGALRTLLVKWALEEGNQFNANLLSEDVRLLLDNSDTVTEFMHLRTVKSKPTHSSMQEESPARLKRRSPESEDSPRPVKSARTARIPPPSRFTRNDTVSSSAKRKSTIIRDGIGVNRTKRLGESPATALAKSTRKEKIAKTKTIGKDILSPHGHKQQQSVTKCELKKKATSPHRQQKFAVSSSPFRTSKTPQKPETLLPFGHLLGGASPIDKENGYP